MLGRLESSHPYRYRVSLALTHPTLSAAELGTVLPVQPDHQGTVGEPRKTPKGGPLPGTYRESFWRHSFDTPQDANVEEFIAGLAETLSPSLPRLLSGGGKARLFIGLFLQQENIGLELSPELMSRCGAVGISLGFDIYGPDPSEGAA
ncbi:DUF4279 domain-containing protein [Lysobacter sp. N42]|nr:DUF4279 domain-containing protein [Lysobacter sp. N42]